MKRQESSEDYLETILILEKKNGNVRSVDIAHEMSFSKPSISRAMSRLRENGLISINESGKIVLTETGRKRADEVYSRHQMLASYLVTLGVPEDVAAADACRIEHDISPITFQKMQEYFSLLEKKNEEKTEK